MATVRQHNWLGNQRVDVDHLRDVEAGGAGDWDLFAGKIIAGELGIVVSGFEILSSSISGQANELQLVVDGALVIHPLATESGSIFNVPAGTANDILNSSNPKIVGSFIADTTNYIGIDLIRSEDDSTSDTTQFYNPDTGEEVSEDVPQARTLDYRIYISTNDFSATPGLLPVAKVVTGPTNDASEVSDCRWMLGRLGSGGSNPDTQAAYAWPGGRSETGDASSFTEGDRKINDLKSILDSLRSRIWEIGGGEYWYSPTADRNVKMIRTGSPFASTGDWFEWVGSNLHWQGLKVLFDNSTVSHNDIADQTVNSAGLTDLADGECIYVDLDRTAVVSLQPQKAALSTLGTPTVPGSRWILAWRYGSNTYTRESTFNVGMTSPVATTAAVGTVKLAYTAGAPAAPVVLPVDANGQIKATLAADNTHSSLLVTGYNSASGAGGNGTETTGGLTSDGAGTAGIGLKATGGTGLAGGATGGDGAQLFGGTASGSGPAGRGAYARGGVAFGTGVAGGVGLYSQGGTPSDGAGGAGGSFLGGNGNGTNRNGGNGIEAQGGPKTGSGSAGVGVKGLGGTNAAGVWGVGNGGAPGIYGQAGAASGSGGFFQSSTASDGPAIVAAPPNTTVHADDLQFQTSAGRITNAFSYVGYPTGKVTRYDETWQNYQSVPGTGDSLGDLYWTVSDVSTIGSFSGPNAPGASPYTSYCANSISFGHQGHATAQVVLSSRALFPAPTQADLLLVSEWDLAIVDPTDVDDSYWFGFTSAPTTFATTGATTVAFRASNSLSGNLNWYAYTVNAGGQGTTSTATAMSSSMRRFRIELWGSNVTGGSNTAYFFINEALVATVTTNLGSDPMKLFFAMKNTGLGDIDSMTIGDINVTWNKYAL